MDLRIFGHVALVQGASKGLGLGVAVALAREGVNLWLTARNEAALKTVAEELSNRHGIEVGYSTVDSGDLDAIPGLIDQVVSRFGRLDILVCNSGGPAPGGIADLSAQQWLDAARLLFASPAGLLKAALPHLAVSPAPRFFAITSSSTKVPVAGLTLSNTYRPGIVGLMKAIVEEFGQTGLCCHSIAPGRFDTDRLANVISAQAKRAGKTDAEVREAMVKSIPAGRLGEPIELGSLVAYLCSPQASYLNGGNWILDGGLIRAI